MRPATLALACLLAWTGLVPCMATAGCRRGSSEDPDAATAAASSAPPPVVVATASPEIAWQEARSGDPLELARLADLEGVFRLGEVAGDAHASEADRAAAIRALSFVDDPTPALETLTALVVDPVLERSVLALQTLSAVSPVRKPIEELEPDSWRTCAEGLVAALGSIQGATRRELAIRALHGLAERGAIARDRVPAR